LQNTHISDPTFLLFFYGFGGIVGSWLGGYLVDRIGSNLPITLSLLVLIIILATFPFITTTVIGASVALTLWGTLAWVLYAPQQHRLLAIAPKVPMIIIALNSSATYLGIAAGSAIGSLIISQTSVLILGPISAIFGFVSLVIYVISSIISPKPKGESTPAAAAPAPVPATVASSLPAQIVFSAPEPAQVAFATPAMTEHSLLE
jgi:predicted MFS family arabinose efflux permease